MKFERQKNIPSLQGKTWSERWRLHCLARVRDPFIYMAQSLSCVLVYSVLLLSMWFHGRFVPHSSFRLFLWIYFVLVWPLLALLNGFFITPRVRRALEKPENNAGLT